MQRTVLKNIKLIVPFLLLSMAVHSQVNLIQDSVRRDSIYQYDIQTIQSPFTIQSRRESFKNYLFDKTIKETFSGPLNQYTDYRFEDACLSATQFLIKNEYTQRGFDKMFEQYYRLDASTRQALLTAVYAIFPDFYLQKIQSIMPYEKDPKAFAICAAYRYRLDSSYDNIRKMQIQINKQFAQSDSIAVLAALKTYLNSNRKDVSSATPPLKELFNYQHLWRQKTIYSFQRWNRDYTGICIIQYENGSFARDSSGKLLTFPQLARSASNLPYFITNGSSPQGIYRIAGINSSIDKLIGPTPNLQTILPFQNDNVFYRNIPYDSSISSLDNYKTLLPPSWQRYLPMQESYVAGNAGRRYIIIHGTTLDPAYFSTKPFYPLTPTDGCLSMEEIWNPLDGSLIKSVELKLVNAFLKTPSGSGLLQVINIDNQQKNVSADEIEKIIDNYEKKSIPPAVGITTSN